MPDKSREPAQESQAPQLEYPNGVAAEQESRWNQEELSGAGYVLFLIAAALSFGVSLAALAMGFDWHRPTILIFALATGAALYPGVRRGEWRVFGGFLIAVLVFGMLVGAADTRRWIRLNAIRVHRLCSAPLNAPQSAAARS